MRIISVYGRTIDVAFLKLESILKNIPPNEIKNVIKSPNYFVVNLKSGDCYKALSVNASGRGHRCDFVFVDRFIDDDALCDYILPQLSIDGKFEFY